MTRSLSSNKPINVEFIAGNAGTFDYMNPTIPLYQMDLAHHIPREFSVYRTDIEASNQSGVLVMDHWTDFKRDFSLDDLSPASHLKLSHRFLTEPYTAKQY